MAEKTYQRDWREVPVDAVKNTRAGGYTDTEIADYFISKGYGDRIKPAREAGYSDKEIMDYWDKRLGEHYATAEQPALPKFEAKKDEMSLGEKVAGGLSTATNALTFGTSDEIQGALFAPAAWLAGKVHGKDVSLKDAYRKERDAARGLVDDFAYAHPKAALAANIAGSVGSGVGTLAKLPSLAKTAKTALGRRAKEGAIGAGMGAAYGVGEANEVSDIPGNAIAYGLLGGVAAPAVGGSLGLGKMGVDKLTGKSAPQLTQFVEDTLGNKIPITKGQLSDDANSLRLEEMYRRGIKGEGAEKVLKNFDVQQQDVVKKALKDVVNVDDVDAAGIGSEIVDSLLARYGVAKQARDVAYEAADKSLRNSTVGKASIQDDIVGSVDDVLESFTDDISGSIGSQVRRLVEGDDVSLAKIENFRKAMGNLQKNPFDPRAAAAGKVKGIVDEAQERWLAGGIINGSEDAIQSIKQARRAHGELAGKFTGKNVSKVVSKQIIESYRKGEIIDPAKVFNSFTNLSRVSKKSDAANAAKDFINAVGSEGRESLRKGAMRSIVDRSTSGADGNLSYAFLNRQLTDLIDYNPSLAKQLFSGDEIKQLTSLRNIMGQLKRKSQAGVVNPSGTAYMLSAIRQQSGLNLPVVNMLLDGIADWASTGAASRSAYGQAAKPIMGGVVPAAQ